MSKGKTYEEYLTELADNMFVMCPNGNGLDSYRIWEALYVGSTPIVHYDNWCDWMKELPVVLCDNNGLPKSNELEAMMDGLATGGMGLSEEFKKHSLELLDFDWWCKRIKKERAELL